MTINKITERVDNNTILEIPDDKEVFHLLMNIKHIVIVLEHASPPFEIRHNS